ncbi:MAG: endonuclease [Bacilli bacterium]|nr:endonuclease [Bacilli bacterium]
MFKKHFIIAAMLSVLSLGTFAGFHTSRRVNNNDISQQVEAYTNGDADSYYSDISSSETGDDLLKELQALNNTKRQRTVGYSSMWSYYGQTDYDPNDRSKYIAFYQGTSGSQGEMNKEHVWPKSRGGNKVEGDIHMPRPTYSKDNSSRGNSFYVEGKNSSSGGWDPGATGMNETYRGDSARIIFYCVVADSNLSLVDKENDSTGNGTMGKLSDLLKWNLQYPVQDRERNRNEGCESIQGNRNPFIDHPEYACKIWGNYNDATKAICQGHMDDDTKTGKLTAYGTVEKTVYEIGQSFDPTGLTIAYTAPEEGATPVDVTCDVTWNPSKFTGSGQISVYAKYNGLSCLAATVTVKAQDSVETPELNTDYLFGFDNKNVNGLFYLNGEMASNNYALATTDNASKAATVRLEDAGNDQYYIKVTKSGGSAQYIESYVDGQYVDLRYSSSALTAWSYDTTNKVFTCEISGCTDETKNGTCFLCSYNAYTDLRISPISYVGQSSTYPGVLYPLSGGSGGGDIPVTTSLNVSGALVKTTYTVGETFDPTGLTVGYFDGTKLNNVTKSATWNLSVLNEVGTFEVKVSYGGIEKSCGNIQVNKAMEKKSSGGCRASITSNSSLIFILAGVGLFFTVRQVIRIKKKEQ